MNHRSHNQLINYSPLFFKIKMNTIVAREIESLQLEVRALKNQLSSYHEANLNQVRLLSSTLSTIQTDMETVSAKQESDFGTILHQVKELHSQQLLSLQQLKICQNGDQQESMVVENVISNHIGDVDLAGVDDDVENVSHPAPSSHAVVDVATTSRSRQGGRAAVRVPYLESDFPESWSMLVEEWEYLNLESFVNSRKDTWDDTMQWQRFSKRLRFMKQLRKVKVEIEKPYTSDLNLAEKLDMDGFNKGLSLSNHLSFLCNISKEYFTASGRRKK